MTFVQRLRAWRPGARRRWLDGHTGADGPTHARVGEWPPQPLVSWRYWLTVPRSTWADARAFVQRGRRGFADSDTWDLHEHLAAVLADSLDCFRTHLHSHPMGLDEHEWDRILAEMSDGFHAARTLVSDEPVPEGVHRRELHARVRRSTELLGLWFPDLWD